MISVIAACQPHDGRVPDTVKNKDTRESCAVPNALSYSYDCHVISCVRYSRVQKGKRILLPNERESKLLSDSHLQCYAEETNQSKTCIHCIVACQATYAAWFPLSH